MKIVSWNINGIRASRSKTFDNYIAEENPDIVCVQETKALRSALKEETLIIPGYTIYWTQGIKAGYSGVAIWVKNNIKVISFEDKMGDSQFDNEGRTIILELENFYLINSYYPNGRDDLSRVPFKLEYSYKILEIAKKLHNKKPVILTGDFNTAHHSVDLARPKANIKNTGFLEIERKFLDDLQKENYVDAFRYKYPNLTDIYSYWSYRGGAKSKNVGWRIDYFWITSSLKNKIESITYNKQEDSSDHCPVNLVINL